MSLPIAIALTVVRASLTPCRLTASAKLRPPGKSTRGISAVHEGNGTIQLVVEDKADARQRDALVKIMSGEETEDMATMWWVFSAMSPNKLAPLFLPIDFEVDVEARRARLNIPGLMEANGEPIRNPVTGAEHRARIDLPHGFEYRIAEIGSGTTKTTGAIKLDLKSSYGQFAHLHLSNKGVVD